MLEATPAVARMAPVEDNVAYTIDEGAVAKEVVGGRQA